VEPQQDLELAAAIAERAERARQDPASFIAFVMNPATETLGQEYVDPEDPLDLIRVPPHQRVLIKFVQHHELSVVMLPADHGKTSCLASFLLWMIARDPKVRILLISGTEAQAKQTIRVMSEVMLNSARFRAVAPNVTPMPGAPWTDSTITVDRPHGIRDATVTALGIFSEKIPGMRCDFIVADDVSNLENTGTKEQREKVTKQFFGIVKPRLVPGGKVAVLNTAMHPEDLPNHLKERGWPTLRMDVLGNVWVYPNEHSHPHLSPSEMTDFGFEGCSGADDLRYVDARDHWPTGGEPLAMRLIGNDQEPVGRRTLWPHRYDEAGVEELRKNPQFDQLYMNLARNDATAMCKKEYVQKCLEAARKLGVTSMVDRYDPRRGIAGSTQSTLGGFTFTGVDLAFGLGEENDETAFFTFLVLPSGVRLVLDVEIGRWPVREIITRIYKKHLRYDSIVVVENNSAQDAVRQWALENEFVDDETGIKYSGIAFPIVGHTTGRVKAHPEYGLPGIFVEMSNGGWAFPNRSGELNPNLERLVRACLYYSPAKHTDDVLMAWYVSHQEAKKYGTPSDPGKEQQGVAVLRR
jgi:hypothetical protein